MALLERLATLLDAAVVRVDKAEELGEIMQGRERVLRVEDAMMTPEVILAAHKRAVERHAGASLVVCNTVARAQELYVQLWEALRAQGRQDQTRLILLHSRFTPTRLTEAGQLAHTPQPSILLRRLAERMDALEDAYSGKQENLPFAWHEADASERKPGRWFAVAAAAGASDD